MDRSSRQQRSADDDDAAHDDFDTNRTVNDPNLSSVPSETAFTDSTKSSYSDRTYSVTSVSSQDALVTSEPSPTYSVPSESPQTSSVTSVPSQTSSITSEPSQISSHSSEPSLTSPQTSVPSPTSSQTLIQGSFGSSCSSLSDITDRGRFRRNASLVFDTTNVDNVQFPPKEPYIRHVQLRQFGGSYAWPKTYKFLPDDEADEMFPKIRQYVPLKDRPNKSSLQCLAETLKYSRHLNEAAKAGEDIHQRGLNILLFFMMFFDELRQFVAPAKPLTSFVGETFEVTLDTKEEGWRAVLEQITTYDVAMEAWYLGDKRSTWHMSQRIEYEVGDRLAQYAHHEEPIYILGLGEIRFDHHPERIVFEYHIAFKEKDKQTDCLLGNIKIFIESTDLLRGGAVIDECTSTDGVRGWSHRFNQRFYWNAPRVGDVVTTERGETYDPNVRLPVFEKLVDMPTDNLPQSDSRSKPYARYLTKYHNKFFSLSNADVLAERCYHAACEHYFTCRMVLGPTANKAKYFHWGETLQRGSYIYNKGHYKVEYSGQYYKHKQYFFQNLSVPDIDEVKYFTAPVAVPSIQAYIEVLKLEQCVGSYTWPNSKDILFSKCDDETNPDFPSDVTTVPFEKRPKITALQCYAEAFTHSSFLDFGASAQHYWWDGNDDGPSMMLWCFFDHFFHNMRRIIASAKPLRSFPGETLWINFYHKHAPVNVFLEKMLDVTAIHARGNAWTIDFHVSHKNGGGVCGAGRYESDYFIQKFAFSFDFIRNVDIKAEPKVDQFHDLLNGEFRIGWLTKEQPQQTVEDCTYKRRTITITESSPSWPKRVNTGEYGKYSHVGYFSSFPTNVLNWPTPPAADLPTEEIENLFKQAIYAVPTYDIPFYDLLETDSRRREDLQMLTENDIAGAERHYRLLCQKYLDDYEKTPRRIDVSVGGFKFFVGTDAPPSIPYGITTEYTAKPLDDDGILVLQHKKHTSQNIKFSKKCFVCCVVLKLIDGSYYRPKLPIFYYPDDDHYDLFRRMSYEQYIPFNDRPVLSSLQCIAQGFAFLHYLDNRHDPLGLKKDANDDVDFLYEMKYQLLFFYHFILNLRRLFGVFKPLTSFVGENLNISTPISPTVPGEERPEHINKYFHIALEQIATDKVAVFSEMERIDQLITFGADGQSIHGKGKIKRTWAQFSFQYNLKAHRYKTNNYHWTGSLEMVLDDSTIQVEGKINLLEAKQSIHTIEAKINGKLYPLYSGDSLMYATIECVQDQLNFRGKPDHTNYPLKGMQHLFDTPYFEKFNTWIAKWSKHYLREEYCKNSAFHHEYFQLMSEGKMAEAEEKYRERCLKFHEIGPHPKDTTLSLFKKNPDGSYKFLFPIWDYRD